MKDRKAYAAIKIRISRLSTGNVGDAKMLGGGVGEMRVHYGPGYRLYFMRQEARIILLLCGGTKKQQDADIARAKRMASEIDNGD